MMTNKGRGVKDEVVLDNLRDFLDVMAGRKPTITLYNNWHRRRIASSVVLKKFGTWKKALAAAGLEYKTTKTSKKDSGKL